MTATHDGKPLTARGEPMDVPPWMTLPAGERYPAGMAIARGTRQGRARSAAADAIELARQLAARTWDPDVPETITWNVRGQPRTRRSFGLPHPGDFAGGLPPARDYPAHT